MSKNIYYKVQYQGGNHPDWDDLMWGHDSTNKYFYEQDAQKRVQCEIQKDLDNRIHVPITYRIVKVTEEICKNENIKNVIVVVYNPNKKEFDEDFEITFTDREVEYLKDLVCQQDDKHELVYNITKKLGGYDI